MKKYFIFLLLICLLLIIPICTVNGQSDDFDIAYGYLKKYNGTSSNVTIPSSVTEIGNDAFINKSTLQSVVIPSNVKKIGVNAFAGCYNLRSVNIQGAEVIEAGAFLYCNRLSDVILPDSLDWIGAKAFYDTSITRVTIPANVSEIYDDPFPKNAALTVTKGSYAQQWAAGTNYRIEKVIDGTVTLPASISLSQNNLDMVVNDYLKLRATFSPANVTNKAVIWTSSDPDVVSVEDVYSGDIVAEGVGTATITAKAAGNENVKASCRVTVTDITCPSGVNQADLPDNLKEIKNSAFENDKSITKVILPDGVSTIGNRAFANSRCLTLIYIPDSVTSIGEDAFLNDNNITFACKSDNYGAVYARQHNIDWHIK